MASKEENHLCRSMQHFRPARTSAQRPESICANENSLLNLDPIAELRCFDPMTRYRFFHPPRCPGAPPLERGAGPNSGPDCRESVGWKILVLPPMSGLRGLAPPGR